MSKEGSTIIYWYNGPGKHSPTLVFYQITLSPQERNQTLKALTDKSPLLLHTHHYSDVIVSATEAGTVHGILFKRMHWSGTGSVEGKTQGVEYLGLFGSTLLQLEADSPDKSTLPLEEASILTFQPKQ